MSWRRFRTLYAALSPESAVCRNYARTAARLGLEDGAAGSAWNALTGLARPGTEK